MPVVPFVLPHRNLVSVFFKQVFVGCIAMRPLPARELHKVTTQFLFALPEGAAAQATALRIGFSVVNRRVIDFESAFVTAPANIFGRLLHRIIAGYVDAVDVHLGNTVGHHIDEHFGDARGILDPYRFGVPEPPGFR